MAIKAGSLDCNYPSEYQNKLKSYHPKSAEEAFQILLKDDYINEVCDVNTSVHKNKTIKYLPKMPIQRYPEFKQYHLEPSILEKRINRVIGLIRQDIDCYNRHIADLASNGAKERINREISLLIAMTEKR
jgi:hypothetical protein